MDALNVKVILGSTREGRFSDKAGNWIKGELEKQGIKADVLDHLRHFLVAFALAVMNMIAAQSRQLDGGT